MTVYILASCLNRELLANTLMVFSTIRRGFPTATINVFGNGLDDLVSAQVEKVATLAGSLYTRIPILPQGVWIEQLLQHETAPFWICDAGLVFHNPVEHWFDASPEVLFAGPYEPEFIDPETQSIHVARLHPGLMWINPRPLRAAIRAWPGKHKFFNAVEKHLIRWSFLPVDGKLVFYDTCAGLHQAVGGTPFTEEQNACFENRFAGSYSYLMGPHE